MGRLYDDFLNPVRGHRLKCLTDIVNANAITLQKLRTDHAARPRTVNRIRRECLRHIVLDLVDRLFSCLLVARSEADYKDCLFLIVHYPILRVFCRNLRKEKAPRPWDAFVFCILPHSPIPEMKST